MADPVKLTDQVKEGEPKRSTATAKTSTENFTAEQQAQSTEKFTTYSGEEPKKVLVAAIPGESLEEFTARTNQYHEEQERKAKEKPAVQPLCIGGFEDGSMITAVGKQQPADKIEPPAISHEVAHKAVSVDPRPSYVEGLKAIGNNEEAQGLYSIEYMERKGREALAASQKTSQAPDRVLVADYDRGTHAAVTSENTPGGWLTVVQRIAQLPMDQEFQVLGSGLLAGVEHYQHDERERTWGRLIGTVQGTGEVLQGLAKIADFGAACILGDNERAGNMGDEFGTALGQTIVGGVRLFQAADQYLFNIGYSGDYAKPFRDIAAAGQNLDEQWSRLPPREQERVKTKLITELVESGAIGAGGAGAVQKASKFTEVLDAVAVEAKAVHAAARPGIKKAVKAINNAVDELVQPLGDTGMGVRMPIPKDPLKDETKMLMSKADDIEPKRPEGGRPREPVPEKYIPPKWFAAEIKQVLERLSPGERAFIDKHAIQIKPIRQMAPGKERLGAYYDPSENTIYVPEQVFQLGKPVPNYDLEFAFRHEFGHAYNAKLDPFGDYISNLKAFKNAFTEDLKRVPPDALDELRLSRKYKVPENAMDEVFADMYGHACGLQSNNPYSQRMKQWFPNCLKYLKEMPKP